MTTKEPKNLIANFLARREVGVIVSLFFVFILFSVFGPNFFRPLNLQSILINASWIGIIAIGESYALGSGALDLSVSGLYGLSALLFVIVSNALNPLLGIVLVLLMALTFGLTNGLLVVKAGINPLIVTLGTQYFARGLIYLISQGFLRSLSKAVKNSIVVSIFTETFGGGWSLLVVWLIVLTVIFHWLLFKTKFGQAILAVGSDPDTSLSQGILPGATVVKALIVTSALAGFSGITAAMELNSVTADLGTGLALKGIAAAVLGGCALSGGKTSPIGAVLGAIFLASLNSGLIMIGAPTYSFIGVLGIALIAGIALNRFLIPWLRGYFPARS